MWYENNSNCNTTALCYRSGGRQKYKRQAINGKLYCAPRNAENVLIIDPINETASLNNFGLNLEGSDKWHGIIQGIDGKIYMPPLNNVYDILIIDPKIDFQSLPSILSPYCQT